MSDLDEAVAASAFARLLKHLRLRSDVQNVDLMGEAGFCRNCLADWIMEASNGALTREASREIVYGMAPSEWKAHHQTQATAAQIARMDASVALNRRLQDEEAKVSR